MRARGCRRAERAGATDPSEGDVPRGTSPDEGPEPETGGAQRRQPGDRGNEPQEDQPVELKAGSAGGTATRGGLPLTGLQLALLALTATLIAAGG